MLPYLTIFTGTTIASSLMDKQGRKSLLITSFCGMVGSFTASSSLTFQVNETFSHAVPLPKNIQDALSTTNLLPSLILSYVLCTHPVVQDKLQIVFGYEGLI